ncbi:PIG-L family deacetylase [Candidatus Woesebacteria bacterium]|nr:PIG-L family deacetylase [Candidatus Woesebacteria bacterium]
MQTQEIQKFVPDPRWKEHSGALLVVPHADDEVLIGWGLIQTLVDSGIPVTVLLLSLGEKGKVYGNETPEKEIKAIRREEFYNAAEALGVRGVIYEPTFPDSELSQHQTELNTALTRYVREQRFDVIVSFASNERTFGFDHTDHHAVAAASVIASEKADMPSMFPDSGKALTYRPSLLGWTTNPHIGATHQLSEIALSEESKVKMGEFLSQHYPSQFSKETKNSWGPIFDRITQSSPNRHRQLYFQTR